MAIIKTDTIEKLRGDLSDLLFWAATKEYPHRRHSASFTKLLSPQFLHLIEFIGYDLMKVGSEKGSPLELKPFRSGCVNYFPLCVI